MNASASISLRSDSGVSFGRARHIELTRLVVETPAALQLGAELEFQLELPGLHQTVYGSARVRKAAIHDEDLNVYRLAILHLRAGDETMLREWVEDMAHGGTSAYPHRHVLDTQTSSVPPPSHPPRRRGTLPPGAISTWDLNRRAEASPPERGRHRVRAALRQRLRGGDSNPPSTIPEITLHLDEGMARLELRFPTPEAWGAAWQIGIKDGGLLIPMRPPHPALGSDLELLVHLPDGTQVSSLARVEALLLEGIGIAIVGDPTSLFPPGDDVEDESGDDIEIVVSEP